MRRLALRSLAAHKGRLAMTLAAVCLGTAFVAGTMLFSASAGGAEAAVPERAARASGARVGDTVRLLRGGSRHQATVVGVYAYRALGDEAPPAMAFQEATAQRLLGIPGQVTAVDLAAMPGAGPADLAGRVQAAVPGATVTDGPAANAEARDRRVAEARTLRTALLGFAAIALVVGGFVIANTFLMLVGRRTRELALLRAVGLSRRQLRGMVLGEAAVVGLLGGVPGIAVYGYAALTDQIDEQVGTVGLGGAALLILAVVVLAPGLCRLLLRPLAAPLARLGATGRLAAGNAARNPRRTAATASALMISLSVVTGLAIFGHSVKRHTVAGVRRDVAAPLVVQPAGRGDAAIPQAEVEQLARVPGVRAVAALRYASLPLRAGPLATQAPATVTDPAAL